MTVKQKIMEMAQYFSNGSVSGLGRLMGMKQATISAWCQRNSMDYVKVAEAFPQVSAEWLLRGKGDMLDGYEPEEKKKVEELEKSLSKEMENQQRMIKEFSDKSVESEKAINDAQEELKRLREMNDKLILKYVLNDANTND